MNREKTTNDDQNPSSKLEQSPRKQPGSGGSGVGGGGGGLKRDEWSEGAVNILLEAYESKWILRNRAKLKGQDWEDVAKCVSSRSNNSKSPKTLTQCKNKIESMKKRYRSESAVSDTTSWPFYSRLDRLLRATGTSSRHGSMPVQLSPIVPQNDSLMESFPVAQPSVPPQHTAVEMAENNYRESIDLGRVAKEKSSDKTETDSSTPALYSNDKDVPDRKRRRRDGSGRWGDVAKSIRWLADAVVRSEKGKMETMKEVERIRVEAEVKRGEMELKRTEIIANTQLEIATLLASVLGKTSVDSSLRIGRI